MAKKIQKPEASEQETPLTNSSAIPEFDALEAELDRVLEEPVKPKRGGKKKAEGAETEPALPEILPEDLEYWVCFPLDALFTRTEKPVLTLVERKAWSMSASKLINKYLPLAAEWQAEIGAAVCLATIFGMRYAKPKSDSDNIRPKGNGENNMDIPEPS